MYPGAVLADRYRIEEVLTHGSAGHVYRGRTESGVAVVIKILQQKSRHMHMRFAREVAALKTLRHPGIVGYLDSGITGEDAPFLVMEWLDGDDLALHLARHRLGVSEALELGVRIS